MFCVRWDSRGIINLDFLKRTETLNARLYVQQLPACSYNSVEKLSELVNRLTVDLHGNAKNDI